MTKRLYYADSYLKSFSGRVLEQKRVHNAPAVLLDQTAFYPDSGGQPHDTGFLGEAHVLNVIEDDQGGILHVLDREVSIGSVSGQIDWVRRFDHMQQHTGQHILSQAFLSVAQAQTFSFHLGAETSTIDVDWAQPSPTQMEEAQMLATNVVFSNRAVNILATDREALGSMGVRKESQREGEIRVIDIEAFDRSPCGGTHVRRTGEIGIIFVSGFERYKGGTRVEYVAGGRALKLLQKDHELLKRLARIHSSTAENLPEIVEKLLLERATLLREFAHMQDRLLETEARGLIQGADRVGQVLFVLKIYSGRKLENVKTLAQKLTAQPNVVAILGMADACQIITARSRELSGSCGEAVKKVAAALGGKGGGRPELAQAGGFSADSLDPWMKALQKYFESLVEN